MKFVYNYINQYYRQNSNSCYVLNNVLHKNMVPFHLLKREIPLKKSYPL